ncbi:MAG: DUF6728 family protein [Bacteroidia bacterium]
MSPVLKKIAVYMGIRKPDPNDPDTFNLKVMHGINRISIIMFLVAIVIMLVRFCG